MLESDGKELASQREKERGRKGNSTMHVALGCFAGAQNGRWCSGRLETRQDSPRGAFVSPENEQHGVLWETGSHWRVSDKSIVWEDLSGWRVI